MAVAAAAAAAQILLIYREIQELAKTIFSRLKFVNSEAKKLFNNCCKSNIVLQFC